MRFFLFVLLSSVFAGIIQPGITKASICDNHETVIYFGNGVKGVKKEASKSSEIIENRLEAILSPEEFELLDFKLSYNDTHTLPLDLLESTIQFLTGNTSRFWRLLFGLEIIPDWFADKFILLATLLDNSALLTTDSLKDHVNTYKTAIAEGKRVILVAHSQGNLYGNQAFTLLSSQEQESFALVSTANVDSNVLGDDSELAPYTTLESDRVIAALIISQLNLPTSPMDPNTVNIEDADEFLNHSFISSYMGEGSNSQNQIVSDILTTLNTLPAPYRLVEPGVITVSLTWGDAPDIDLHVYEPNGTHVYWYNMEGLSGRLDRDDRSRHGPEHYHVPSCETLEDGIYRIGLDYFKGDIPDVATIQVEAGLRVRTFEFAMPSENYGTDYHPVLVSNIWVKKNSENGGYDFEIFE